MSVVIAFSMQLYTIANSGQKMLSGPFSATKLNRQPNWEFQRKSIRAKSLLMASTSQVNLLSSELDPSAQPENSRHLFEYLPLVKCRHRKLCWTTANTSFAFAADWSLSVVDISCLIFSHRTTNTLEYMFLHIVKMSTPETEVQLAAGCWVGGRGHMDVDHMPSIRRQLLNF